MSEPKDKPSDLSEFDQGESWHRLSPWSVLHYVGSRHSIFTSTILGALALNLSIDRDLLGFIFGAGCLMLIFITVLAIAEQRFFRYHVGENSIQIRQGVFFKKKLNLKFRRIQNANIVHPFFFRPLGLVTLKLESAGSASKEVYISAVTLDRAQSIRQRIKQRLLIEESLAEEVNENELQEKLMLTRTLPDLVLHGLTNNRAWVIVGGLAGLISTTPISFEDIFAQISYIVGPVFSNQNTAYLLALFLLSLTLTVAVTASLSVIGSIVSYYGFSLFRSDNSLTVHQGLFNKQEVNLRKSRIQSVHIRQDWLDRVLGRVNIIFEQISHNNASGQTAQRRKKLLVPSVRVHEISSLLREFLPIDNPAKLEFIPISKRYFYKLIIVWSVVYILLALALASYRPGWSSFVIVAIPLWFLHMCLLFLTWKRAGLTIQENIVIVRAGIIGIDFVLFPAYKLQDIAHTQSILMKKKNLSNVLFSTASRRVSVPYLPTSVVRNAIDHCLFCVESSARSWM